MLPEISTTFEGYLDIVNTQRSMMSQIIIPGIYNIAFASTGYRKILKVVKQ